MKEAMLWKSLPKGKVKCYLCPRECVITDGGFGFCTVRKNVGGRLQSLVYGRPVALAMDPIEKKPLYHFAPGSFCLSLCTIGCTLDCSFCQNYSTTARDRMEKDQVPGERVSPERVVELAKEQGAQGIAYTYTEPTVYFEYALDIMKLARSSGLYNVWVSNGFTSPEAVMNASRYLDAINIDLKGPTKFYKNVCKAGSDKPVLEAAKLYKEQGVWVETTTLLIPGHNDSGEDLKKLCSWINKNLGPDTPVHFSRFHPHHRMRDIKQTPVKTLEKAFEIAKQAGLKFVYLGNVPGHESENTRCPGCGNILIKREGRGTETLIQKCDCGQVIPLRGMNWSRV